MNEISPIISRAQALRKANRAAFLRLAINQRRRYWQYRRWALEDEAAGNLEGYRKHMAEANRLRESAHWHINHARETTHGA